MVSATKLEGGYCFHSKNSPLDQPEGVKIHLYRLGIEQCEHDTLKSFACAGEGSPSLLDTIILSQWENFAQKGQLGYDVTTCELKVIEGQRDFVIQMNDKWNSFSLMKYDKFGHPFGCLKPNSARSYEELLLCIAEGENNEPEVVPSITPPNNGVLLIANAYPVEYGHIFLVPNATNQLSSFWDKRMFGLITKIASEVNSAAFRVFFDDGTSIVPKHMFFQVKNLVTGCCLSAWECCGYFVYHTKVDFDRASETGISNRMASFSFQDGDFEDLKKLCCAIADSLVT
ncbi:unnamed protein product [Triticum turgidum subsp. durum]|uniref:GDPGP1-like N-terminal domain-containing protein n=1 Tax=Triticum turgidum subsp. durum TaxID=4567 RepID=A0A9R1AGQ1_TRITD|nr:unnamed protein product [Triticum turgidum subsp. durum]